jgi:hypothetical protein
MAVTNCNIDMESLITDQNRSIATLAITTLLKTGAASGSLHVLSTTAAVIRAGQPVTPGCVVPFVTLSSRSWIGRENCVRDLALSSVSADSAHLAYLPALTRCNMDKLLNYIICTPP